MPATEEQRSAQSGRGANAIWLSVSFVQDAVWVAGRQRCDGLASTKMRLDMPSESSHPRNAHRGLELRSARFLRKCEVCLRISAFGAGIAYKETHLRTFEPRRAGDWVLIRRARADKFKSASSAAKPSPVQGVTSCRPEKPDTYWSALRGTERPVISVVEIRYVRRSELKSRPNQLPPEAQPCLICAMASVDSLQRVAC